VVDDLYYGRTCPCCSGDRISDVEKGIDLSPDVLTDVMNSIYHQEVGAGKMSTALYRETRRIFEKAAAEGMSKSNNPNVVRDTDFMTKYGHSIEVFSAFRAHAFGKQMAQELKDKEGNLRSYKDWNEATKSIQSHFNQNWLQTEYNTAVLRSEQAAAWQQFGEDKDVMPNLKWMPTSSATPREDHAVFWQQGLTLPVDDSFWDSHYPADEWNCKCWLEQTDSAATKKSEMPGKGEMPSPAPGLTSNPGKQAEVFSPDHPYFDIPNGEKEQVEQQMTEADRVEEMVNEMKDMNLTEEEKNAIAENNLELEKELKVDKGNLMTIDEADKQSANPNYQPEYIPDPNGHLVLRSTGEKFSENPKYDKDSPFSINCQTCCPAYNLRLRGFDVTAKGCTKGSDGEYLTYHPFEAYTNIDGSKAKPTTYYEWADKRGYKQMTVQRYKQFIAENCKEEGVYELSVGWKKMRGVGHVTIIQRLHDGSIIRVEPQVDNSRERNSFAFLNGAVTKASNSRGILRIDNKLIDPKYAGIFAVNKK
jgi:hypothetical protein